MIKKAFIKALPVMAGYLMLGMGLGITLVSIIGGTVCYMLLIQFVF